MCLRPSEPAGLQVFSRTLQRLISVGWSPVWLKLCRLETSASVTSSSLDEDADVCTYQERRIIQTVPHSQTSAFLEMVVLTQQEEVVPVRFLLQFSETVIRRNKNQRSERIFKVLVKQ